MVYMYTVKFNTKRSAFHSRIAFMYSVQCFQYKTIISPYSSSCQPAGRGPRGCEVFPRVPAMYAKARAHTHTHTHIFRLTPFLVQIPCARIPSLFYSLLNSWTCTIKGRQKGIRGEFNDRDCKKPLIEPVICWRAWVVTYTRFAGFHYSKLAQRVTLLICIPGRPGSILVWDISHTDWDWSWISSMLQGKVWDGSLQ